jgi:hypothetical protein
MKIIFSKGLCSSTVPAPSAENTRGFKLPQSKSFYTLETVPPARFLTFILGGFRMDDLITQDLIAEGYTGDELLRELEIRKKLVPIAVQNMVQDIIEQVKKRQKDLRTVRQRDIWGGF